MSDLIQQRDGESDLLALARDRRFKEIEAIWMQRLEQWPTDVEELFRLGDYLVRKKFTEQGTTLLWSLVQTVGEKSDAATALETAKRAARIAPENESLRQELVRRYQASHPDMPELKAILDASNIAGCAAVEPAIALIEHCMRMRTGAYVIHVRSRRVGRVQAFSDGACEILSNAGAARLALTEAVAQWEPVEQDDFRALVAFEPERLRAMSQEDPARLIELCLKATGGRAEFKQLKFMLIPAVIPAKGWSAWWNAVKVLVKRCPRLDIGTGTQPTITLRSGEDTYASKFLSDLDATTGPLGKARHAMTYLAELEAGHEAHPELGVEVGRRLFRIAESAGDLPASLALLSVGDEFHARHPEAPDAAPELVKCAATVTDPAAILRAYDAEDLARLVLQKIVAAQPERQVELLGQAFAAGSLRLCDWIARELLRLGARERLIQAAERAQSAPEQSPEAFAWTWRWLFSDDAPRSERLDPIGLTLQLLRSLHRLSREPRHSERHAEARQALVKLRSMVSGNDFRILRDLIASSDAALARRLHDAIAGNDGLSAESLRELLDALREKHPEEFADKKPLWEDGFIYTSAEALERRHAELEKLVNVDMLKNAQAIGKAASLGDLRENWEYKAALEERDRLVERATRMREEVGRARVLGLSHVTGQEVTVGAVVQLKDTATGEERRVAFVGPWEADIAQGRYSYLAPLSLRFMGRKPGDTVRAVFGDHEADYEIIGVEPAYT